jgi:hypothetical protein
MEARSQVKCFAQVSLDRRSIYVQQPFKVTITVLTATWYTAPLDFDNIQIPSAFILPFDQTQPGMYPVGDKQYAGLQFYFIVFPYKAGSFTIPSFNIVATTPPEGSSESRKVTIKTAAQHFIVKAVPTNLQDQNWLVAKNVIVSERWSKPLRNLKVGDIVERYITIDAKGTLPQFIPQLQKESLDFASSYLQDAELKDERDEYDANGKLTQSVTYLFEKEGNFEIPAIPVKWWNPNTSKLYSRSAPGVKIHVAANPNLGILTTIKDSLAAKQPIAATAKVDKGPRLIAGIPWYWFILYVLAGIAILYILIRLALNIYHKLREMRQDYLASEKHWFRRFLLSPAGTVATIDRMYNWWDRSKVNDKGAAVSFSINNENDAELKNEWKEILASQFDKKEVGADAIKKFKTNVKLYREKAYGADQINKELVSMTQQPLPNE